MVDDSVSGLPCDGASKVVKGGAVCDGGGVGVHGADADPKCAPSLERPSASFQTMQESDLGTPDSQQHAAKLQVESNEQWHEYGGQQSQDPRGLSASATPSRGPSTDMKHSTSVSGGMRASVSAKAGNDARSRCCPCVLRPSDADVQAHSAHLGHVYTRAIKRVTDDAVWQPLEWRGLLHLAVHGDGDETCDLEPVAPAQVLWRDVVDVSSMSRVQLWVARLSLNSEVWAVRMGRAWEGRFRGWNVLFGVGVFSAALLVGRNLAGPVSRCKLLDDGGEAYFDFCDPEPSL